MFDILNTDRCPFCQGKYTHRLTEFGKDCSNLCITILLEEDYLWRAFYIKFSSRRYLRYYRWDKYLMWYNGSEAIEIPLFDCFKYNLNQLENKIKGYLVFQ
jgi:hypothetical protein